MELYSCISTDSWEGPSTSFTLPSYLLLLVQSLPATFHFPTTLDALLLPTFSPFTLSFYCLPPLSHQDHPARDLMKCYNLPKMPFGPVTAKKLDFAECLMRCLNRYSTLLPKVKTAFDLMPTVCSKTRLKTKLWLRSELCQHLAKTIAKLN